MECAQCGSCCCDPVIEVTDFDLKRLVKHTGIPADKLIKLYALSDFEDDDGSGEDWITFSYGKRKIALRKKRNGDCMFLSKDRNCTVYTARPLACRVFPIDVILNEDNKVTDLDMSDVVQDKFIRCKHINGNLRSFDDFRKTALQAGKESDLCWKKIKRWNGLPEKGGKDEFLDFLGLDSTGK